MANIEAYVTLHPLVSVAVSSFGDTTTQLTLTLEDLDDVTAEDLEELDWLALRKELEDQADDQESRGREQILRQEQLDTLERSIKATSEHNRGLTATLEAKQADLERRLAEVDRREAVASERETQISERLVALGSREIALQEQLAQAGAASEEQEKRLAELHEAQRAALEERQRIEEEKETAEKARALVAETAEKERKAEEDRREALRLEEESLAQRLAELQSQQAAARKKKHRHHKEKERKTSEKEDKKAVLQKLKSRRPPPAKGLPQVPVRSVATSEETWQIEAPEDHLLRALPPTQLEHPEFDIFFYRDNFMKKPERYGKMERARKHYNYAFDMFIRIQPEDFEKHLNLYVHGPNVKLLISVRTTPDAYDNYVGIVRSKIRDQPFSLSSEEVWAEAEEKRLGPQKKPDVEKRIVTTIRAKFPRLASDEFIFYDVHRRPDDPRLVETRLLEADVSLKPQAYGFGVLYVGPGQTTATEAFKNDTGSPAWEDFLHLLGARVPLKGWSMYRGALDSKTDTKGTHSHYTSWGNLEIMYHVSTLIPEAERKPLIGNRIVSIVFLESDSYDPATMDAQVNHIQLIVQPSADSRFYRVSIASKKGVPEFGPALADATLFEKGPMFREWFMQKLVNAERSALHCRSASNKTTGKSYLDHLYGSRARTIEDIVADCDIEALGKRKEKKKDKTLRMSKIHGRSPLVPRHINTSVSLDLKFADRVHAVLGSELAEFHLYRALAHMALHFAISGRQDGRFGHEPNKILLIFLEISSRLEPLAVSNKLIENFHLYLAEFDEQSDDTGEAVNRFIEEVVGLTSPTTHLLKACSGAFLALAVEEIVLKTNPTTKIPYKDAGSWEVEVVVKRTTVEVYHRKRQSAVSPDKKAFHFEFELRLRFSRSDFTKLPRVTLYVTDLHFSPDYPAVDVDKIREVFKQFLSPELEAAAVFNKPLAKPQLLVIEAATQTLVEMGGCQAEGLFRKNPPKAAVLDLKHKLDSSKVCDRANRYRLRPLTK